MIEQKLSIDQLPAEIKPAFHELKLIKHLNDAGFKKKFGFTCATLFRIIFVLLFQQKNWFRLLESRRGTNYPGKDTVYRFLNHSGYAWRRFLTLLSRETVHRMESLTSDTRETAFIFDDSMFERNRSKVVEMLARFKDHATGAYYKGFRMLTMGWTDGHSFVPVDFSLLSSNNSSINGIAAGIDKRSSGYKRRKEALQTAPVNITAMLDRAIAAGMSASYVLMDSWFTHAPLIQEIRDRNLHVIGMVK
ncbi:IS4 family transposase, partial [Paenibacillus solanacearum]|uniref:IS4 family transposase n=1 Tax=Paenibacillus solanacearum TaxID=2048548 RepID=UPI001C40539D